jgi:hypothetical protein
MDQQRFYPGSNTAAYFAARGVHLSPDESRELVRVCLRLAEIGALDFAVPGNRSRASGAGAGHGVGPRRADEGPTVYNMGPSRYIGGQE